MIKLSKLRTEDAEILVFDVRSKEAAAHNGTESKVLLGRITPGNMTRVLDREYPEYFQWESRWGFNRGRAITLEEAQEEITFCAQGLYK